MTGENEEVSIREIVIKIQGWYRFLRNKRFILILVFIVGIGAGIIYSSLVKTNYTAELNFAVQDDQTGGLGSAAGLASQFGFDIGGTKSGAFSGDNLIELLKSRAMVEKALLSPINFKGKNETLASLYIDFNDLRKDWIKEGIKALVYPTNELRSNFNLQQDSILNQIFKDLIKNCLAVDKSDKKLSIIQVKVVSKNEIFSKLFAENLVKTVSKFYIETTIQKESQNVNILQHQVDSVRRQLNIAISGVAQSLDINPNPNPSLQILRAPSQRRQIDVQANTAILTELVKNLELSQITLRKETPLIQIIDYPILPLEKTHLGKLKAIVICCAILEIIAIMILSIRYIFKQLMKS